MFHSSRHPRNLSGAVAIVGLLAMISAVPVSAAVVYSTGFESFAGLAGQGWSFQNNSSPVGPLSWSQGNPIVFPAHAGPDNSYMSVNFQSTTGTNTISNWSITPTLTYNNGYTFSFFTRTVANGPGSFPDRLQVRLSTNGSSANVGATNTSVGDFTSLLLDINPTLTTTGYPASWTQFTATISGLAGPVSGRMAFRYFVTNGGPNGANSDYIGIDTLTIDDGVAQPPPPPPPSTVVGVPSSIAGTLAGVNEVDWYSFVNPGGTITINTLGSLLTPSNDTEIGLYDSLGNLVVSDDDSSDGFLSQIITDSLVSGSTYYVSVSGFNTTFSNGFGVTSTSSNLGSYQLNITTTVPEPGTTALLGVGLCAIGGVMIRRRQSA